MSTFTPYMNLELPDILTYNTLGTLPQDWALILNADIVKIDAHDHATYGKKVASENMTMTSDKDLNQVQISKLSYIQFATNETADNVSLYIDGTDLFWKDLEGTIVQITAAGALNVTLDIGGFFGDYGSTNAYAFLDTAKSVFGFNGIGPNHLNTSTITCGSLDYANTSNPLQLTALIIKAQSVFEFPGEIVFTNQPFVARSIVTKESTGFRFSSVVGDGSPYAPTFPSVPITDPNGIFHLNETLPNRINPNVLVNAAPNPNISQKNSIELFANASFYTLVDSEFIFQPGETKRFTITHAFPLMAKIPHWDGKFSVNLCKWGLQLNNSFFNPVDGLNPIYKTLRADIISVTHVSGRTFEVKGTFTNITDISVVLPNTTKIIANLRIAAIFPTFNGQGVFFGEQY